jgi:hypothetical protein
MRTRSFVMMALAAVLFMGAKGCSDCEKKTAAAAATCQALGEGSDACKAAKIEADKACAPVIEPPATCNDGFPPGPEGCPKCEHLTCQYGCTESPGGGICKPKPEPVCPEACPAGQECKDPAVGCVAVPPPPATTCVPACKATESCVKRGSVEPFTYECVPVTTTPEAPLIRDEDLTYVGDAAPAQMWAETDAAISRWRTLHPEKWNGNGSCLVSVSGIDEAFLGISTELLRVGIVAGQSITDDGKRSDCTFVNRTGTKLYEEGHLFDYARACVATGPNAMKGLYRRGDAPPVEPPPATASCPYAPCPFKLWTAETLPPGWGEDAIGTAAWKWNAKLHTMGNADSTPVTVRQEPFCHAIGMSPMADGTLRASCPMRPDGHTEREAVENWLLDGGPVRDSKNGQDCTPNNTDNPFAFLAGTGNCRICNALAPPGQVCSEWF